MSSYVCYVRLADLVGCEGVGRPPRVAQRISLGGEVVRLLTLYSYGLYTHGPIQLWPVLLWPI